VTRGMTVFVVAAILIFVLSRKKDLLILDFNLMRFGKIWFSGHSCLICHDDRESGDSPSPAISFRLRGNIPAGGVLGLSLLFSGVAFFGMAHLFELKEANDVLNTARELLCGSANRTQRVDGQLSFESDKSA
jgi:hypothetical protein